MDRRKIIIKFFGVVMLLNFCYNSNNLQCVVLRYIAPMKLALNKTFQLINLSTDQLPQKFPCNCTCNCKL